MTYLPNLTLNVCNPPPVWSLAKTERLFPPFSVVCSHGPPSLLILGSWLCCQSRYLEFFLRVVMETISRLLGSMSKQKRGVADKLQARHWSHHFQLNSPHYSSSQHLSSSRHPSVDQPLPSSQDKLFNWGIHNSSYTVLIYTSTVLFLHANMEKVCEPCAANILLTCSSSCFIDWKKDELFQLHLNDLILI